LEQLYKTKTSRRALLAKELEPVAWHVTGSDKKKFWSRIGAAWSHKDGQGFNLQLDTLPIDGRIVLRHPQEPAGDEKARA
jgi:hypothetical protein